MIHVKTKFFRDPVDKLYVQKIIHSVRSHNPYTPSDYVPPYLEQNDVLDNM